MVRRRRRGHNRYIASYNGIKNFKKGGIKDERKDDD